MGRRDLEDKLFVDFEPLIRDMGLALLDVELTSENKASVLRATIHKPEGVTLDDCASVQNALSDLLDATDPVAGSYTLEVSSPGLERTLRRDKEFATFKGKPCQANLFAPVDGKRVFLGDLVGLEKDLAGKELVALETPEGVVRLDRSNVSKVKLVYHGDLDL
jgi:ribosome maturation factor RimP